LGEHLLRRRMELGLRQQDVGKQLKVDAFTVLNWEKDKTVPPARYLPRIVAFLGYDPSPAPQTLGERIVAARRRLGIPRKKLALRLNVDEGALKRWEEDRSLPQEHCLSKILAVLRRTGIG
jgi:transcriptional regulator with XRE-family HTH domain